MLQKGSRETSCLRLHLGDTSKTALSSEAFVLQLAFMQQCGAQAEMTLVGYPGRVHPGAQGYQQTRAAAALPARKRDGLWSWGQSADAFP